MIVFLSEYTPGVLSSAFINKIFGYLKRKEKRSAINMIEFFYFHFQLMEDSMVKLDRICRKANVILIFARSYGLTGLVRISLKVMRFYFIGFLQRKNLDTGRVISCFIIKLCPSITSVGLNHH